MNTKDTIERQEQHFSSAIFGSTDAYELGFSYLSISIFNAYLLVCVTSSLRIRWYFNTLCIGTANRSLNRNLPSFAACSHAYTESLKLSSLVQRESNKN